MFWGELEKHRGRRVRFGLEPLSLCGCVTYGGSPRRPLWISIAFFHMGFAAQNPTWGFYTGINYCEFLLRTVTRPIFHMGFPTFSSERHTLQSVLVDVTDDERSPRHTHGRQRG